MSAEFAVCFLHSLGILTRELKDTRHKGPTSIELFVQYPSSALWKQISPKSSEPTI